MEDQIFFAGSNLDREAEKRADYDYIESLLTKDRTQILLLSSLNPIAKVVKSQDGAEVYEILFVKFSDVMQMLGVQELKLDNVARRLGNNGKLPFLGSKDSINYFACDISGFEDSLCENGLLKGAKVLKSRLELLRLGKFQASLVAQSRSILDWNNRYRFCATCGSATRSVDAGYKRNCSNDDCLSNKGELKFRACFRGVLLYEEYYNFEIIIWYVYDQLIFSSI